MRDRLIILKHALLKSKDGKYCKRNPERRSFQRSLARTCFQRMFVFLNEIHTQKRDNREN